MNKMIYVSAFLVLAIATSAASAFTLKLNDNINMLGCFKLQDSDTSMYVDGIPKNMIYSFSEDVTKAYSGSSNYQIKIYPISDAAPVPVTCKFILDRDQFKIAHIGVYKDHCTVNY